MVEYINAGPSAFEKGSELIALYTKSGTTEPDSPLVVVNDAVEPAKVVASGNSPGKKSKTNPGSTDVDEESNIQTLRGFDAVLDEMGDPLTWKEKEYWRNLQLINRFNYYHCNEVSPVNAKMEITPIFITYKTRPFRVAGVRVLNTSIYYDLFDAAGLHVTVRRDHPTVRDFMENGSGAKPFMSTGPPADMESYTIDYDLIRPMYGRLYRYYYDLGSTIARAINKGKGLVTDVMTEGNETWDEHNLDVLTGGKNKTPTWTIDARYIPSRESFLTPEQVAALYKKKDPQREKLLSLDTKEQTLLRSFLFYSAVETIENRLELALSDASELDNVESLNTKQLEEWRALLNKLRERDPVLYRVLDPLERVKPGGTYVATTVDEADATAFSSDVVRGLQEALVRLQENVDKTKLSNNEMTKKLAKIERVFGEYDTGFGGLFGYTSNQIKVLYGATPNGDTKTSMATMYKAIGAKYGETLKTNDEAVKLLANLKKGESNYLAFYEGIDVISSKEHFNGLIRSNVYKGKYNAEVVIHEMGSDKPRSGIQFSHISTYTDENGRLVYGAKCSKNNKHVFHNEEKNKLLVKNGTITINMRDESGRLIKSASLPFAGVPESGHLYMLKSGETKLFLSRSLENGPLEIKTLVVPI